MRVALRAVVCLLPFLMPRMGLTQDVSRSSDRPWEAKVLPAAPPRRAGLTIEATRRYTLAELVDLGEEHNPETRVAWQRAKALAGSLGIARSALFPTLAGVVLGQSIQQGVLFGAKFYQQDLGIFEPALRLDYTVFDFGSRQEAVTAARANLLAANFGFNNTHLQVIYRISIGYYQLLNALGQLEAAQANLVNAENLEKASEARLANGLATLPDVLEARAAAAQANYELASAQGAVAIAHGELASSLGLSPATEIQVQPLEQLAPPSVINTSIEETMNQALRDRPDLLQQSERIRASEEAIKQARNAYLPDITFAGQLGRLRGFGEQTGNPGAYATGNVWDARLSLDWTIFNGGRRESELARAHAEQRAAQAEYDSLRDEAEDQVWVAYSNVKTAQAQQQAAAALLSAATESYNAATDAYSNGVRTLLDVLNAQRALAQARSEDVSARTSLYRQVATLAFRTGDLLRTRGRQPAP